MQGVRKEPGSGMTKAFEKSSGFQENFDVFKIDNENFYKDESFYLKILISKAIRLSLRIMMRIELKIWKMRAHQTKETALLKTTQRIHFHLLDEFIHNEVL